MIKITKRDLLWLLFCFFSLGILVDAIIFDEVFKETKKDQDNAVMFVYGYKNGFNAALTKVYQSYNISGTVLVAGFTETTFEGTRRSIEKSQWDFNKMEYKY